MSVRVKLERAPPPVVPLDKDDWGSFFAMPALTEQEPQAMEVSPEIPNHAEPPRPRSDAHARATKRAKALAGARQIMTQAFSEETTSGVAPQEVTSPEEQTSEYLERKDIIEEVYNEDGPDEGGAQAETQPLSLEAKRLMAAVRNPEGKFYVAPPVQPPAPPPKRGSPGSAGRGKPAPRKTTPPPRVAAEDEDSDSQDAKLSHRIRKDGKKHEVRFQAKLRRKNIDACPPDAVPEDRREEEAMPETILVRPAPDGTWVSPEDAARPPETERMAPPEGEEFLAPGLREETGGPGGAPGLLRGVDYNMATTKVAGSGNSGNRKVEDLEDLTPEQLMGIRSDLDRPMSTRQAADAQLPTMHQLFYYPHDENRANDDPPEFRHERRRQGQRGDEYYSLLEEEKRRKREQDAREELERLERENLAQDAAEAMQREQEGRKLERTVEETFDALVIKYRDDKLDMSRIFSYLQRTRNVFVHEGSESVLLRKLANAEPHDRLSDDSWLRQARPGEPECMKGPQCEGRKIGRGTVPVTNIARFSERDLRDCPPGTLPTNISRPCEMCRRASTTYHWLQNRSARQHMPSNVAITDFCNLPDDKGQYALEQCVMNSSHDPSQLLPVPVVMHCRGNYRQVPDEDGYYSWRQDGYYMPTADLRLLMPEGHGGALAETRERRRDFGSG